MFDGSAEVLFLGVDPGICKAMRARSSTREGHLPDRT